MDNVTVKPLHSVRLVCAFITGVFPAVKRELDYWRKAAGQMPDSRLRRQALESMRNKTFHCQGGSIYALYPGVKQRETVRFIVAYQTMSDYLDNLVDSLEVQDERAFSQLHVAMWEALEPEKALADYYLYYPYREDGGYLQRLVTTCQDSLKELPAYSIVREEVVKLAKLYACLQTYKHLSLAEREEKLLNWSASYLQDFPGLTAWEFAAATGSTLGIFCLYAAAWDSRLTESRRQEIERAYFPWLCGLHILLDYFIDLREDRESEQLNFVAYYADQEETRERLNLFVRRSLEQAKALEYPKFHKMVTRGLLAMYLSDEKCLDEEILPVGQYLIRSSGPGVQVLYWLCRRLRKMKRL